jgi:hypothetical protein
MTSRFDRPFAAPSRRWSLFAAQGHASGRGKFILAA